MITPEQAAAAVVYLIAAGCATAKDQQGSVWADYLNHEIPNVQPLELTSATRAAVRDWAEMRRTYQVDVEHVAAAMRRARKKRLDDIGDAYPEGLNNEPMVEHKWQMAFREAVYAGCPRSEAIRYAWQSIERTPPPLETPEQRKLILNQIGRKPPSISPCLLNPLNAETIGKTT